MNVYDFWPKSSDWDKELKSHFESTQSDSFARLSTYLFSEFETETIYPAAENIFRAFELTSFADTKVVILGQDPYHGPGQAHGLSFSVARPAVEHRFDSPGRRSQFAQETGLGRFHRCRDRIAQCTPPTHRVHPLGETGRKESSRDRRPASQNNRPPPFPAVSLPRLLRQSPLQYSEYSTERIGQRRNQMGLITCAVGDACLWILFLR